MFKVEVQFTTLHFQKGNSDLKEQMGSLIPVCSVPLIPSWDLLVLQIMQKLMEVLFPSAGLPLTKHFDYIEIALHLKLHI